MCHPGWPADIASLLMDGVHMGFMGVPSAEHRFPERHPTVEKEAVEIMSALNGYFPKGIVEGPWTSRDSAVVQRVSR